MGLVFGRRAARRWNSSCTVFPGRDPFQGPHYRMRRREMRCRYGKAFRYFGEYNPNVRVSKRDIERMARGELPEPSEAEIQNQIADGLFVHGYAVYITSRRPKRCQCGRWPKSGAGDGASRGLADLIVRKRTWPPGVCLSLEVKREGPVRYSSDEQKAAALAGDIVVVQSLEEAIAAADAFDARVRA